MASRPVGVNPFLLFRCGQVPIPDPLAELAGGKILELRHVQHATGQLHIPIPLLELLTCHWVKVSQLLSLLLYVHSRIVGHQPRQIHDTMPISTLHVSILEPIMRHIARITSQPIPQRDRVAKRLAETGMKIPQLMAGYLARLVDALRSCGPCPMLNSPLVEHVLNRQARPFGRKMQLPRGAATNLEPRAPILHRVRGVGQHNSRHAPSSNPLLLFQIFTCFRGAYQHRDQFR